MNRAGQLMLMGQYQTGGLATCAAGRVDWCYFDLLVRENSEVLEVLPLAPVCAYNASGGMGTSPISFAKLDGELGAGGRVGGRAGRRARRGRVAAASTSAKVLVLGPCHPAMVAAQA